MPAPKIRKRLDKGTHVRLADDFLEGTGQFTAHDRGPDAPCHWGYNARGIVLGRRSTSSRLLEVLWDDGHRGFHLGAHLTVVEEEA